LIINLQGKRQEGDQGNVVRKILRPLQALSCEIHEDKYILIGNIIKVKMLSQVFKSINLFTLFII